ncbi:MAG: MltA domain-containing protein [Dongiaceae bacterium]
MTGKAVAWVLAVAVALAACEAEEARQAPLAPATPRLLTRSDFADLPGWGGDSAAEAIRPFLATCAGLARQPHDRAVGPGGVGGTVADWLGPCRAAIDIARDDDPAATRFFEDWFRPYAVGAPGGVADEAVGLFTGYYEPELRGARRPDGAHAVPLYRRPADLVTADPGEFGVAHDGAGLTGRVVDGRLRPYPTRAEIDGGALVGRGLELLWIDDPIDVFFLHIQGSGRVRLADGGVVRVGYAASNGRPFVGIARLLIDSGAIPRDGASMQSVRDWLRAHPDRAPEMMQANPRYIFFREFDGAGPIGAAGVVLTPLRSLAVDPAFMPLGAPLWLDTVWPPGGPDVGKPLRRLMIAQDTGGAIKGAVRGDVFWGTGDAALARAGGMKQRGRYFLLLPRAVAERRDAAS